MLDNHPRFRSYDMRGNDPSISVLSYSCPSSIYPMIHQIY